MQLTIRLQPKVLRLRLGGGRVVADVITMYRRDTLPALDVFFLDYDPVLRTDNPTDLSGAGIQVRLKTIADGGVALKTNALLVPVNAAQGHFQYLWQPTDVDTAGTFKAEVTIEYPTFVPPAQQRTVKQFTLVVLEDLP